MTPGEVITLGKDSGGNENLRKNREHPDHNSFEID